MRFDWIITVKVTNIVYNLFSFSSDGHVPCFGGRFSSHVQQDEKIKVENMNLSFKNT